MQDVLDKLHITRQEYIREDNQRERHEDQVRTPMLTVDAVSSSKLCY